MRDRSRAAKDRVRNLMEGITLTMTEEEKRMAVMIRGRGQGTLGNRTEGIRAIHLTNGAAETDYFRYNRLIISYPQPTHTFPTALKQAILII